MQHDSFYIRCQMPVLSFHANNLKINFGDILHVTDSWQSESTYLAWKVNNDGTESVKGTIPNAAKFDRHR